MMVLSRRDPVDIPYIESLPTATYRMAGKRYRTRGSVGVASDTFECVKLADDTYSWQSLILSDPVQDALDTLTTAVGTKFNAAKVLTATTTVDFGTLAAGATSEHGVTIDSGGLLGAAENDAVIIGPPSDFMPKVQVSGYINDSINFAIIRITNHDTVALTAGSKTWRITVIKP